MIDESVVEQDHKLEAAAEGGRIKLAEHRWHWTLDESNPKRYAIREYARSIKRGYTTVYDMVTGHAEWRDRCAPISEHADYLTRTKLRGETRTATEAVAKSKGVSIESARRHHAGEVREVKAAASERAERRGTKVDDEIENVAQDRAKSAKADQRRKADRAAKSTVRYVEVEGKIATAMTSLRRVLDMTEGVDFGDDERELLVDSLGKLRALLNLLDVRLTGATDIDWDAEMIKMGEAS